MLRSDPVVNKFISRELARSISDAAAWLEKISLGQSNGRNFNWAITFPANDVMIGSICLWNFSADRTCAELGYDLLPDFHGEGIMTEAVSAILDFALDKLSLSQIEAFTSYKNEASIKMLQKHGFMLDADKKDQDNPDNTIYVLKKTRKGKIVN